MTVRRAIIEILYSDSEADEVSEILDETTYFAQGLLRFLEDGVAITVYDDLDPGDDESTARTIEETFG